MDGGEGRFFRLGEKLYGQSSKFAREVEHKYEQLYTYQEDVDCSASTYADKIGVAAVGSGHFARARVIRLEAASLNDLSAIGLSQVRKNVGITDRNSRIVGGFAKLVSWLSTGASLIPNAKIVRIDWRKHGVVVFLDDGMRIIGRSLAITVPVDILRTLLSAFVPQIPENSTQAINSLGMGPGAKVLIHVRRRQWPNFSAYATDGAIQVWWNHEHAKGHTLVGFTAGPGTQKLAKLSREEYIKQATEDIHVAGGSLRSSDVLNCEACLWNTPGNMAYSYIPVNAVGSRERLAAPIDGRIWFAGEAAVPAGYAGTVSGAVESATLAAHAIVAYSRKHAA